TRGSPCAKGARRWKAGTLPVIAGPPPAFPLWEGAAAMESWLVTYDIADPKRLRKVALTCEDFGGRSQYSVFLCPISATDLVRLRSRLYDIIDLSADQVLFIPLCPKCVNQIEALGRPTEAADAKDVVVVV